MRLSPTAVQRLLLSSAVLAAGVLAVSPSLAVQPARWVHTTEADFEPGKHDNTVVTNLGDVKLSAGTHTIGKMPEQASVIYDMQAVGKDLFLASGPEGKLLRRRGDKIEPVASFDGEQVFSLDTTADGKLLLAISGTDTRLAVLDGDKVKTVAQLPGIRYVWDMAVEGKIVYLATGTEGRLLRVDLGKVVLGDTAKKDGKKNDAATKPAESTTKPDEAKKDDAKDGKDAKKDKEKEEAESRPEALKLPGITELLHSAQANLLCLAHDGKGRLYAGTDTDGLIYRVTVNDGKATDVFVLYDASEPEIGTLLVTPDGEVFAGTSDADQARPGRLSEAESSSPGRPETIEPPAKGKVAPPEPGDIPQLPPKPDPKNPNAKGDAVDDGEPVMLPPVKPDPNAPESSDIGDEEEEPMPGAATPHVALPSNADLDALADRMAVQQLAEQAKTTGEEPTKEAHDRLREVIRQRLESARKSGALAASPMPTRRSAARAAAAQQTGPRIPGIRPPGAGPKEGNAVYRISPDGFVREVFRESVMILKLLNIDGKLLVATGNEGKIFRVDPAAGETIIIADLEAQQIPSMLADADGTILLGTANPATLVRMDAGFSKMGKYTSPVLDSEQISLWGRLHVTLDVPQGTSVTVQTRSGNAQDPDVAAWSAWSEPVKLDPAPGDSHAEPRDLAITSPPARFLQYQLTFTGGGTSSAVVNSVEISHIVPNLKPVVASIHASYPDGSGASSPGGAQQSPAGARGPAMPRPSRPMAMGGGNAGGADNEPEPTPSLNVEWEASDPNNDALSYKLDYQPAGAKVWLPMEKDLTTNSYEWQTRRVPDGRYVVRVTASDATDNPADMALTATRQTDPVVIDNTPPQFEGLKAAVEKQTATVTGKITDALSTIRALHYAVDGEKGWKPALPDGLIFDSTSEAFTITITGLSTGHHAVTLRGLDARGNPVYQTLLVEVK
ncbi:MAG: hypothetical protein K8S99_09545 [Planctomycetes bacterium]|nr:hypothetical protein [Planctomycetota bacterium]